MNDETLEHPTTDETPSVEPEEPQAELQLQIATLIRERDEARDQALRHLAEMQNFRRMSEQRLQQDRRFATERLVRDLLPVLDNFDRALAHLGPDSDVEQVRGGLVAVQRQLLQALEGQGVKKIQSVGEPFDPERHEAIATGEGESGTVLDEIEAGYVMADRVVRPARVRVAG